MTDIEQRAAEMSEKLRDPTDPHWCKHDIWRRLDDGRRVIEICMRCGLGRNPTPSDTE